ncbi:DUF3460 family protein [Hydrogenophilus thiooxidans]|uniref:DUF3460 family protein n=1 Tax=Hydrogenophilus thiooxidans TaxID=2820326 RepID=UPI001C22841A|nr:DUF3460 family protein [Hydrogenophilus thiooxidans]
MTGYVSEATRFLEDYLSNHPEQREVARQGRALWWDKPQDAETTAQFAAARVPTYPYSYDTSHPQLDPFRADGYRLALPPRLAAQVAQRSVPTERA